MEDRFTKEVRCVKIHVFDEKQIDGEKELYVLNNPVKIVIVSKHHSTCCLKTN